LSLKNFLPIFIIVVATFLGSTLWAEELNVYFKTTPRSELLRPFVDPTDLSLLITETDGRPVEQGTVAIRLEAPRPGRFFSTDFPLVEGTVLSEMQLPLRQGRANWKQLFPIRGEYRLSVEVVSRDGSKVSKAFTFDVRENHKKWLALAAFSAGLIALGFVAGRVFTGARESVASLLAAAALLIGLPGISRAQQPSGMAVLEIEPATVGRPTGVRWSLPGDGGAGGRTAMLTLSITHLEKKKVVFAVEKIAVAGEWSMKFHFPDGGEYRVAAVGNVAGSAPVRNEQVIAVAGVEPPAAAMMPVLSFFTALIAVGLGVGRWSKRRARPNLKICLLF
jgi:hypothetical protein